MSSLDAIERVAEQLRVATSYMMVFGVLPAGDTALRKAALRKEFAYLVQLVHPDLAPKGMEKQAAKAFRRLNDLRRAAEAAIEAGTYDTSYDSPTTSAGANSNAGAAVELQSSSGVYRLRSDPFRVGDFSLLYQGHIVNGGSGGEVVVKIASEPQNNSWLEREAGVLGRFHDPDPKNPLTRVGVYVPELLDTFLVSGERGQRFRANVMRCVPDLVSVAQIIEAYPRGLNPQDAAWVCRRILAQTLAASMAGLVHGAIVPDHVLVNPFNHEPLHIGWAHSVDDSGKTITRITHVIDRWKECYPREVFEKKPVDHRTDLFMAGKTMVKLLGGDTVTNKLPKDVPSKMAAVVLRCVEHSPVRRYQNGKQVLDEFTRVVRSLWGKVYRPLTMPIH